MTKEEIIDLVKQIEALPPQTRNIVLQFLNVLEQVQQRRHIG